MDQEKERESDGEEKEKSDSERTMRWWNGLGKGDVK